MTIPAHSSFRIAAATLATVAIVALCGCNLTGTASEIAPVTPAAISGAVHGGQQPVSNATVNLYAAGATGYGSAATLLAATTTNQAGQFSFTPMTSNPGPGITSAWQCPTTTPASDPQIYIMATGGNSSGTGATTVNSAIALVAALGNCSQISSSTFTIVNEITTAATVYALAQYLNPGSAAGDESIGTNGVNYTATGTTPQGAIGLNNAVASLVNLASLSGGVAVTSNTYTGTSPTATGVVVTATPDSAKLTTVADMLASCINTTSSTSSNCADLFNNSVPPPTASVTSQPSITFPAATDTIQAAYYLAVNPANNSSTSFTAGSCNNTPSATSRAACLFGLSSSDAPFQPGLSGTPNDWTIGVTYSSTSTCGTATNVPLFISGPIQSAVDANGNIWFNNAADPAGSLQPSAFGELSPIGVPLFCGGAGTTAFKTGRGITIDPAGNVWAAFGSTAKLELVTPGALGQTSCTTPTVPYGIVSDGNGNIFYTPGTASTGGAAVYVFPSGSTNISSCSGSAASDTEWIASGYAPTSSSAVPYIAADGLGRIWLQGESNTGDVQIAYPVSAPITAYSVSGGTVTFTAANSFTAGQVVTVAGLTTAEGVTLDHQNFTVASSPAPTATQFSATTTASTIASTTDAGTAFVAVPSTSTPYTAGAAYGLSNTSYGLAIDNNNYGYSGYTCCSTSDEALVKVTAGATSATAPAKTVSSTTFAGSTGSRSFAVDGAGNVWFGMAYPEVGGITSTAGTASTDIYGVGEFYTFGSGASVTFTALSPSGMNPGANCASGSTPPACAVGGGFQDPNLLSSIGIAIDPSGNVWVPNTGGQVSTGASTSSYYYFGTSITELLGAAVPVVTPISVGLKNGTQGTKP